MSKKNYQKPRADYVAFYSEQEIATTLPISDFEDDTDLGPSTSAGTGTGNPGWED